MIGRPRIGTAGLALCCATLLLGLPNLAVLDRVWSVWMASPGPPSAPLFWVAALAYLAGLLALVSISARLRPRLDHPLFRLGAPLLVLWALLATAFAYPQVDSGRFGFTSDRDEALDVGVRQMLSAGNPYDCRVIPGEHHSCLAQGNPIGPLPGALLLATPFVLLGMAAWQSVFWLAIFLILVRRHGDAFGSARVAWLALLGLPIVSAELLTGGDLLANALWMACACLAILKLPSGSRWLYPSALLIGLMLAGRSHFLLLLPVLCMALQRRHGWGRASAATLCMLGSFALLAVWYYPASDGGFGPLDVQQKLRAAGGAAGQYLVAAASMLAAVTLGLVGGGRFLYLRMALSLSVPAIGAVVLHSLALGQPSFAFYGWYLLAATPFALLSLVGEQDAAGE